MNRQVHLKDMDPKAAQALLKEVLSYDPVTGVFRWRVPAGRWGRIPAGSVAGNVSIVSGYRLIGLGVSGRTYRAGHLAWLYMTGEWPPVTIDHINQTKDDDRFSNLRPATFTENKRNSPKYKNNTSGFPGVHWREERQCWRARVVIDGKPKWIGSFATAEEANVVRLAAVKEAYGEFAPGATSPRTTAALSGIGDILAKIRALGPSDFPRFKTHVIREAA